MNYTTYKDENLGFSKYLSKCFLWMFLGLLATFATSALFSYSGLFLEIFSRMGTVFMILVSIIEIVLVLVLSVMVYKLDAKKASVLFFVYAIVNGITLSSIFYVYDLTSIIYVFLATAGVFGMMAFIGYTTNLDLSKLRVFIPLALLALIVMGIVLAFSFNETAYIVYSVLGIGLFMIITTYDIHIIKHEYYRMNSASEQNSLAIYGALQLYLDFINIFLHLLALFAKNKD